MSEADRVMKDNLGRRHGMGVMSAKLFNALVTGMTTEISDLDDISSIGRGFKDVFSNKEFEGKDSNYPYSEKYYEDVKEKAGKQIQRAFNTAINNIRGVSLGGSSGSEAVRQARLNAGDMAEKPNKVVLGNEDKN